MNNTDNANDEYENAPPRKEVYVLYPNGRDRPARKWLELREKGLPKHD